MSKRLFNKNRRNIHYKLFVVFFAFLISVFFSTKVSALNIKVTNISVADKSSTIAVDTPTINNGEVTSNITFNEVNDYVIFELTLNNNETDKYKVESIKDNNTNKNLEISYQYSKDYFKGENKIKIKLLYKNKLVNQEKIDLNNLNITIELENDKGESQDIIINNPTTGDNILMYLLFLILALTGMILISKKTKVKEIKIGSLVLLISLLTLPFVVFGIEKYEVKIKFTDIEIKGEFEKYNITINPGNGNTPIVKEVTYGQKIGELPTTPSKEGYDFEKWVDNKGNEVTEDTVITGPISVEAKYKVKEYTISYDLNGGTVTGNPDKYTIESNDITLKNPSKEGYTFTGWTGTGIDTKTTSVTIESGSTGNRNYTANYSANEDTAYKVKHRYQKLDSGYEEEEVTEYGETGKEVEAPIKSKTGFANPSVQRVTIKADGSSEVIYNYDREIYTFNISDRTYIDSTSTVDGNYPYETEIKVKALERAGYDFVWSDGSSSLEREFDITESTTLTPIYTAKTNTPYKVVHQKQKIDGTYEVANTQILTGTTDSTITPEVKTYEGFTSPSTQTITIKGDGTTVVTYNYTRNKYILTIENPEYVEEDKSGEYYYEEEVTLKAIDREGYTFAGWSNGETTKDVTVTIGTSDITISPTYTANKYNVIFNVNGGTGTMSNQELTYDLEANLTKNTFTKTNYIFDGWNTKEDGTGTSYEDEKTVKNLATSGSITLYAQWTFDSSSMYIISFDTDSETVIQDKEITPGDSLGTLEEPTKEGKVFVGWYTDSTDGELVDENYTPESSMTLYARYKDLLCKKATTLHTATCPSGKSCVNAGYTAGGSHGTNIVEFGSISYSNLVAGNAFDCDVNGDGTYDATNERFYYLRTLDDKAVLISHSNYEGSSGQAITDNYDYGTALTMLPTTSSTQWKNVEVTFNNEYDTTDTTTYAARFVTYDDLREVTGKQTLSATGSLDDYAYLLENTQFVGVGRTGTWLMSETVNDVTTYYRMHTGTSNRHVKSEETTSKNVARPVIEVPMKFMETTNIDVTTYKITFETNGGTAIDPINIEENTSIGTFPTTTRNGYEFVAWYYDPELTNEVSNLDTFTEDTTIYAKWNAVAVAEINGVYYNTIASAISSVPTTGVKTTVKLIKNATENITIPNNKDVVLDLNNYTLSNNGNNAVITNNGNIEIINGTISSDASQKGAINVNSGIVKVSNATIEHTLETSNGRQAIYNSSGTVYIEDGAILKSVATQRSALHNLSNGTVYINGGTIISKNLYAIYNESGTITIGTKDNAFDNTTPVIQGKTFAIAANNNYNFYDGILKGGTSAVGTTSNTGNTPTVTADTNETKIANLEDNSTKVYGTEDIEGTTYNTLYCTVDNAKIKVTFEPNGGEVDPEFKMINSGDPIGELPTPTRGIYTFDGWYTGLTDGVQVQSTDVPTGNVTYYARWHYEASNEVINFNMNNDALDTYFTNISTWKDLDQATFQSNMSSNFTANSCSACNGSNACNSPAAGTYCEQPKGYDTALEDDLLVYTSDENTKEKGSLVTYTTSTDGTIYNMIPGETYYWESSTDSNIHGLVKATANRRTIKSSVRNIRDLGGLEVSYTDEGITKSGTIKYGKLFRGAQLSSSSTDVTELAKLGVDYEIDLRPASDGNSQAAFTNHDSDIIITNYLIYPDTYASNYTALKNALKDTMNYVIAHKDDDKALYFHCTIGTDRTGTLAYFLEGLLGASEEDRVEDYELSYYYGMTNRDRYHDNLSGSSINPRFTTMHNTYDTNEKIYNWFFAKDTTQEEIDADKALIQSFRDAMINYN